MAVADLQAPADAPTEPSRPSGKPESGGKLPHFPALDGLRGVAVAAVLCFHGGFSWMIGGYLGVSTFFTLSGFLITSLLLAERAHTGRVALRQFWIRRFRRLMPASLACLALALVFGVAVADPVQRANLAGDTIAALAYVANWRFMLTDQSYADLFAAPSPLLHFWSLAIEEQFYLVYPLIIAGLVGFGARAMTTHDARREYWFQVLGRNYRSLVAGFLVIATGVSYALMRWGGFTHNHIYFGTFTRASELLIGGILAVALFHAPVTRQLAKPGRVRRGVALAGVVALGLTVVAWVEVPQSSDRLYAGGFSVYAVISAAIIAAAILPVGPVRLLLAFRPLRHLGRISYGVYLYHWPIFLWLRQKSDLEIWPRFAVGVAITIVLAELSFWLLEMPIRRGQNILRLKPVKVAPYAIATLAVLAMMISSTTPEPAIDFDATQESFEQFTVEAAGLPSTTIDPASLVPPIPRVGFYGDSTALMTSWGVASQLQATGEGINVSGVSGLGCSVLRSAKRRTAGEVADSPQFCNDWENTWRASVDKNDPDMAVVQVGPWDIADRQIGDETWRGPGDPVFDQFALAEMTTAVDTLSANDGTVIWLTSPIPGPAAIGDDPTGFDPAGRMEHFNELVKQLPALRPGKVLVVDLAEWVGSLPADEDSRLRPDGVHFTEDTSVEAAQDWIVDSLLQTWRDDWVAKRKAEIDSPAMLSIVAVGDGTAQRIGSSLSAWGTDEAGIAVDVSASPACGMGRAGVRLNLINQAEPVPDECNQWGPQFAAALQEAEPDIVVAHTSVWDVTDRQLANDAVWRSLGDPVYETFIAAEIGLAMDTLHATGAHVVWLSSPHVDPGRLEDGTSPGHVASDPARVERLNQIISQEAAERDFVTVIDYAAFARQLPGGEFSSAFRPAGMDVSEAGAQTIAEWLGPQLLELAVKFPNTED